MLKLVKYEVGVSEHVQTGPAALHVCALGAGRFQGGAWLDAPISVFEPKKMLCKASASPCAKAPA